MADLYTLLQDTSLLDEKGLAYYHAIVSRLIKSNNTNIKQEIIEQVNTDIGSTVTGDINAKIDKLREELTNASEEDLTALRAELIADVAGKYQQKIIGTEGQTITFDKDGNVIAIDKGSSGGGEGNGSFGMASYHFQDSEWVNDEIHIPASKHNLTPSTTETVFTVYGVNGHNITDYDNSETQLNEFKADIIAMYKKAIEGNNTTPGTYPTDSNGYITFTWEQVQYYLLEDILATAEVAAQKAAEYHFNWKDTNTLGVTPTCTLSDYLNAAYMPALNGPAVQFNNLSSNQNIQGWRFRRIILKNGEMKTGANGKYDMVGSFYYTWGAVCCHVHYDTASGDIVVKSNIHNPAFEGFVIAVTDT